MRTTQRVTFLFVGVVLLSCVLLCHASDAPATSPIDISEALDGPWSVELSQWKVGSDDEPVVTYGNATFEKVDEHNMKGVYVQLQKADATSGSAVDVVLGRFFLSIDFDSTVSGRVRFGSQESISANEDETTDDLGLKDLFSFFFHTYPNQALISHGSFGADKKTYEFSFVGRNSFILTVYSEGSGMTITGSKILPEKTFFQKYGPMVIMLVVMMGMRFFTGRMASPTPSERSQTVAREHREENESESSESNEAVESSSEKKNK